MAKQCLECAKENSEPCCNRGHGLCEAWDDDRGISNCVHCGGELREVNGLWYHHSQFNNDMFLISPERPQDYVKFT